MRQKPFLAKVGRRSIVNVKGKGKRGEVEILALVILYFIS
jgi:hypothetical protein